MTRSAACVCLALLGLAGTGQAQVEGLVSFQEAFQVSNAPAGRMEARTKALAGLTGESSKVVRALLSAATTLEEEAAKIEEKRRRELFQASEPDITLQRREVLDPLRELQRQIAGRLLDLGDEGSIRAIVQETLIMDELPFSLRLALAERAGEVEEDFLSKIIAKLKKRDVDLACVALTALLACDSRPPQTLTLVTRHLNHDSVLVRELATRVLADFPNPKSIQALVKRIEKESGRTRKRMGQALEVLTREPLGDRAAAWKDWWEEHKGDVNAGRVEIGGGRPGGGRSPRASEEAGQYHSITIDGEAVLFVLDRSQSMVAPMRDEKGPDGSVINRMEMAKKELAKSLGALPSSATFNIVVFATGSSSYSEKMVTASVENVAEAKTWLQELELGGGTALYDGAELGFALGGQPIADRPYECSFDTLFLLTDGLPTIPVAHGIDRNFEEDSFESILAAVRRWNLMGRVVVHTIGLGQNFPAPRLRALAEENGGRFVQEL